MSSKQLVKFEKEFGWDYCGYSQFRGNSIPSWHIGHEPSRQATQGELVVVDTDVYLPYKISPSLPRREDYVQIENPRLAYLVGLMQGLCSLISGELRVEGAVQAQFDSLAALWRQECEYMSNMSEMFAHPAYQRIIGMGLPVVPILLQQLAEDPDYWFWALRSITGEDPVHENDRGDLEAMSTAWLNWGRANGMYRD